MSGILDAISNLDRGAGSIAIEVIQKILQYLAKKQPKISDDAIKRYIVQSLEVLQLNTSVTIGDPTVINSRNFDHETVFSYSKKINKRVRGYPLVHTTVGGPFTFPVLGSKFGCGCLGSATAYIRIDHHSWLDIGSGACLLAGFIKFTGTSIKMLFCKKDSSVAAAAGAMLEITNSGDSLTLTLADGVDILTLQSTALASLNDGNWHSFVVNIPATSGNAEIFIDKISKGTASRNVIGSINNVRNFYVFGRDNAGVIDEIYGENSAILFAAKKTWVQAEIDDFHDKGIIAIADSVTTTNIELFFLPMEQRENSRSNAFVGMCKAGV